MVRRRKERPLVFGYSTLRSVRGCFEWEKLFDVAL